MKISYNWLKDYLNTEAPSQSTVDDIIIKLTELGLEVDDVDNRAEQYASFKVAKVQSAEKHPDADRLKVCKVETDDGVIQVVCGAPNARTGMTGVFAPTGSYIPGLDTVLQKGVIRGQESHGMLVSEREMCLSDDHEGIIDLDNSYDIGTPISDIYPQLNDVIIDIGLTPDRADCAGILGVARDLAASGMGKFELPKRPSIDEKFESPVNVQTNTPETCPHFVGRTIRNVKNCESPDWLKQKLEAVGLRPISALVDITNYFCVGLNRPLHVYDVDKLKGDICVKIAKGGEQFDALNDKSYTLDGGETVITDDNGVLGLGGIVGGTSTGCEFDTVNVFLECAYFNPISTARTGRDLQVISDARYRFERGVDPEFLPYAIDLATQMILDICGGEASTIVTAGAPIKWQCEYDFDPELTKKLTGVDVPVKEQLYILGALGFTINGSESPYKVSIPSWRVDIEGANDLVEEVIRVHGYESIEPIDLPRLETLTENALSRTHELRMASGRALAKRGLQEAMTWSFMQYDLASQFAETIPSSLRLTNAISIEMDTMRPSILPNLIQACARNADKGNANAALFETGPVFRGVNPDDQDYVAVGVRHGVHHDKYWSSNDVSRPVDIFDAKADALAVIQAVNPNMVPQITRDAPSYYHPGRSGCFRLGKNILGYFGEIHPAILEEIDITPTVVGFEVFLESIPTPKSKVSKPTLIMNQYQAVRRDFAFLVDDNVEAASMIGAAKKGGGSTLSNVSIFDVYQGKGMEDGKKSIAMAVEWQPTDGTLTDKQIEELSQSITSAVIKATSASLRGV
jgi:phenylalanyl-tRNA synthetase beta chain